MIGGAYPPALKTHIDRIWLGSGLQNRLFQFKSGMCVNMVALSYELRSRSVKANNLVRV